MGGLVADEGGDIMNEYGGRWITTYTGKKFHFLDPQPDEIDIVDIAHALSLTCRFGGQCRQFYSVAEHSIRMAEIVPQEYKLHALLPDASEAYLPDLPRPEKAEIPKFEVVEGIILEAIFRKFTPIYQQGIIEVKHADNILLATEARDLMDNTDDWALLPQPLPDRIYPMNSVSAEKDFLSYVRQAL